MSYENATTREHYNHLANNVAIIDALIASDEAAAVVAGYRAMHSDVELHRHLPGSEARRQRLETILMPVADAWGISTGQLLLAVGRNID